MTLRPTRRRFGTVLAVALAACAALPAQAADAYPSRAIRLVVPWAPGGSVDVTARMVAKLAAAKGLNLVVDNQPGATGSIGLAKVAQAAPDGYTLGIATSSQLALVAQKMTKTANDEFTYLNQVSVEQFFLLAPADSPVHTPAEAVDLIRRNPGKISIGTAGGNNLPHVLAATTAGLAGAPFIHVPYAGGSKVVIDLTGKQIAFGILKPSESRSQIESGMIKAVGVYSDKRLPGFDNVQTFAENKLNAFPNGPLIQMSWFVGPAKLPADITTKLIAVFREALQDPSYRKFAEDNGFSATDVSGAALRQQVDAVQATLDKVAPRLFTKE